jgi:hypothetical protein
MTPPTPTPTPASPLSSPAPQSYGIKDGRLLKTMPNAYGLACAEAKKAGTLAQHLQQTAVDLSGIDS